MTRIASPPRFLALVMSLVLGPAASLSHAGQATYDPATRSFRLMYTYAYLPHFGMQPAEVEKLGTPQQASKDQDAFVRAIHKDASEVLREVTGGRATIGSLSYTSDIKKADVIISLDGDFGRAGWAIPGQIEGRPGQVGLYYKVLERYSQRQAVLTTAHELCHYLFSLPDEYTERPGANCPLDNPQGPGCLMDNYFYRNGFIALCDNASHRHNPNAPNSNQLNGEPAGLSCSLRVDEFFKTHPPGPESGSQGGTSADTLMGAMNDRPPVDPQTPFTGKFRRLVD